MWMKDMPKPWLTGINLGYDIHTSLLSLISVHPLHGSRFHMQRANIVGKICTLEVGTR